MANGKSQQLSEGYAENQLKLVSIDYLGFQITGFRKPRTSGTWLSFAPHSAFPVASGNAASRPTARDIRTLF
jgi:hypothetical protein